jgi:hypothetical protein
MNTAIPFIILLKLKIIFAEKKWGSEKELFNKFCNSLSVLTLDQQNCIMAITKNFLRIEFKDYPTHLINCLEQIQPSNKVYVLPLKKRRDYESGTSKSSDSIAYLFKNKLLFLTTPFNNTVFNVVSKPELLPNNFNLNPYPLFIVDDFIGSGETCEECLNYLLEKGIELTKINIISLVVQNLGYDRILNNFGISISNSKYRQRGITDSFSDPERKRLQETMESIESFLQYDKNEQFGYNRTEALVKMNRTPNNTFPFYWKDKIITGGCRYSSPFPR